VSTSETQPGAWSGPVFTALVLLALDRMLAAYRSDLAAAPGVDPAGLPTSVTVVTATPLRATRGEVRARVRHAELPNPYVKVSVQVDPGLTDPGFRILVEPPLPASWPQGGDTAAVDGTVAAPDGRTRPVPGGFAGPDGTRPYSGPGPDRGARDAVVFTLLYGPWRWVFPVAGSPTWLPLGRGLGAGPRATLRVPDFVTAVPRGALLRFRYRDGAAHLHRSHERTEYAVHVDGQPLAPGASVSVRPTGAIGYSLGAGASTTLRYELTPRGGHDRQP